MATSKVKGHYDTAVNFCLTCKTLPLRPVLSRTLIYQLKWTRMTTMYTYIPSFSSSSSFFFFFLLSVRVIVVGVCRGGPARRLLLCMSLWQRDLSLVLWMRSCVCAWSREREREREREEIHTTASILRRRPSPLSRQLTRSTCPSRWAELCHQKTTWPPGIQSQREITVKDHHGWCENGARRRGIWQDFGKCRKVVDIDCFCFSVTSLLGLVCYSQSPETIASTRVNWETAACTAFVLHYDYHPSWRPITQFKWNFTRVGRQRLIGITERLITDRSSCVSVSVRAICQSTLPVRLSQC